MAEGQAPSYGDGLRDLVVGLAGFYPAAIRAGVGYWADMTANASRYYADLFESMMAAYQRPQDGGRLLSEFLERFKTHLEQSGESVERALLEFNQGLVAFRRRRD